MSEDVYRRIEAFLDAHKIPHEKREHRRAASAAEYNAALGCRLESQAKCLMLRTHGPEGKGRVVFALPGSHHAVLSALAAALGVKRIRLASLDEMKEATGCAYGELPPVGSVIGVRVVVHADLMDEKQWFFNAGRLDRSFVVAPEDLHGVERFEVMPAATAVRAEAD